MKKLTQQQLKKEAAQQKKAIEHLINWLRNVILLVVLTAVFAWWGLSGDGIRFGAGVFFLIATVICLLISAIIGYGIIKGKKNVQAVLLEAEKQLDENVHL